MFIVRDVSEFRKLRAKKREKPLKGSSGYCIVKKDVDINLIPGGCEIHLLPQKKYAELHFYCEIDDIKTLAEKLDAVAYM